MAHDSTLWSVLRMLLANTPSTSSWASILGCLDRYPHEHQAYVIDYISEHTKRWPCLLRENRIKHWHPTYFHDQPHSPWRLVQTLRIPYGIHPTILLPILQNPILEGCRGLPSTSLHTTDPSAQAYTTRIGYHRQPPEVWTPSIHVPDINESHATLIYQADENMRHLFYLIPHEPPLEGEVEPILREKARTGWLIGRSEHSDIHTLLDYVGRVHARIVFDGQDFVLLDQESTNGTWIRDQRVRSTSLNDGMNVNVVGESFFEFFAPNSPTLSKRIQETLLTAFVHKEMHLLEELEQRWHMSQLLDESLHMLFFRQQRGMAVVPPLFSQQHFEELVGQWLEDKFDDFAGYTQVFCIEGGKHAILLSGFETGALKEALPSLLETLFPEATQLPARQDGGVFLDELELMTSLISKEDADSPRMMFSLSQALAYSLDNPMRYLFRFPSTHPDLEED